MGQGNNNRNRNRNSKQSYSIADQNTLCICWFLVKLETSSSFPFTFGEGLIYPARDPSGRMYFFLFICWWACNWVTCDQAFFFPRLPNKKVRRTPYRRLVTGGRSINGELKNGSLWYTESKKAARMDKPGAAFEKTWRHWHVFIFPSEFV